MWNQCTLHHKFRIHSGKTKILAVNDRRHSSRPWIPWNESQRSARAWLDREDTVYWVDKQFAQWKRLKLYQTRCNAIIVCDTIPAYCIPKVVVIKSEEILYQKVYMSPRPHPKISLRHNWTKELVSEIAQRPDGQVVKQFKSSKLNQPNPYPDHVRTGQPVVGSDPCTASGGRKRPVPTRSKHVPFTKKLSNMIELGNPLL